MLRFCANIDLLFTEVEPLLRPAAAGEADFGAVEILVPYRIPAKDWARACRDAGVRVANLNAPIGAEGELGLAGLPARRADFEESIRAALIYAEELNAERVTVHAGAVPHHLRRADCLAVLPERLAWAADRLARLGAVCMTEALNSIDRPAAVLHRFTDALDVVRAAAHPNLKIEADVYHMVAMNESVTLLREHLAEIAHVQISDFPGRHQPGTGRIPFDEVFAMLEDAGYSGWISAEYTPLGRTCDSLAWMIASDP